MATIQNLETIVVDGNGTELAYLDSGAPKSSSYTTICFPPILATFQKILDIAPSEGLRVVAVNRRGYPGSTPFNNEELNILSSGTDEQKTAFLAARGCELARFMDIFIKRFSLPFFKQDGQSGGIALLGWSLGNATTLATIASIALLPDDVQSRLTSNMRSLILYEPPFVALGTPAPPQGWTPLTDDSVPSNFRDSLFTQWVTGYFKHGDISTQDPSVLSYIVPATFKVPSIFNMSAKEIHRIIYFEAGFAEGPFVANFQSQLLVSYRKALFGKEAGEKWMHMKAWEFIGDVAPWPGIVAYWSILEDTNDKESVDGRVNFKIVKGANHFVHWDDPPSAIRVFKEFLT